MTKKFKQKITVVDSISTLLLKYTTEQAPRGQTGGCRLDHSIMAGK